MVRESEPLPRVRRSSQSNLCPCWRCVNAGPGVAKGLIGAVVAFESMRSADTSEEAARIQLEIYRRMPPGRRLELAFELSALSRRLVFEGIRQRHPDYTDEQVRLSGFRLLLGHDLFRAAYPGSPELTP